MNRKERVQHSSAIKPYSHYKCKIPKYLKCIPLHWHKEIEINFMKKGAAEFIVDDEKFIAKAGEIVFVSSESLHSILQYDNQSPDYETIVFSMDLLDAMGNDRASSELLRKIALGGFKIKPHIFADNPYFKEMKKSANRVFDCINEDSSEYDLLLKSELFRMFFYLYKSGCIYKANKEDITSSMIIRSAIEYIEENFRENITIEDLANFVHLSKSYFMNKFRNSVGMGAMEYIVEYRIKRACELLLEDKMNVSEIAFECGFKNLSNFNKHFKRITSTTPIKYRNKHK